MFIETLSSVVQLKRNKFNKMLHESTPNDPFNFKSPGSSLHI